MLSENEPTVSSEKNTVYLVHRSLALLFLIGVVGFPFLGGRPERSTEQRNPASEGCVKLVSSPVDFAGLRKYIETEKILSIENLIPCLPEDMRKNHVLAFKSQSLQYASYQEPRALLASADARFILSFSGNPQKPGFDTLEIIQFNDQGKKFEFKEIKFPVDEKRSAVEFLEQPKTCVNCHRQDPRPNWEPYNHWRGFYLGRESSIPPDSEESREYGKFLKGPKNLGRYRSLIDYEITGSGKEGYNDLAKERVRAFGAPIFYLNFLRLQRKLAESPQFEAFKYSMLASLLNCEDPKSFLPAKIRLALHRPYDDIKTETRIWMNLESDRRKKERPDFEQISFKPTLFETHYEDSFLHLGHHLSVISFWRYLFENRGIETHDWSLNLDPNLYSFYDGSGWSLNYLMGSFVDAINDPKVSAFFSKDTGCGPYGLLRSKMEKLECVRPTHDMTGSKLCGILRTKSLSALSVIPPTSLKVSSVEPALRSGLESCRRCHGETAPASRQLSIDKPELLSAEMKEEILHRISPTASNGMPYGELPLSEGQRVAIQKYLGQKLPDNRNKKPTEK